MHISTYTSTTIRKKIIDIPIVGPTTLHRQGFWSVPHWKQMGKMGINGASHILRLFLCLNQLIYSIYLHIYGEEVRSSWGRIVWVWAVKWRSWMEAGDDDVNANWRSPDTSLVLFLWPIMGRDVYRVLFWLPLSTSIRSREAIARPGWQRVWRWDRMVISTSRPCNNGCLTTIPGLIGLLVWLVVTDK